MIRAAWRDVVFRKRRFAIAITATALVFALSLLLSGVSISSREPTGPCAMSAPMPGWCGRPARPVHLVRADAGGSWAEQLRGRRRGGPADGGDPPRRPPHQPRRSRPDRTRRSWTSPYSVSTAAAPACPPSSTVTPSGTARTPWWTAAWATSWATSSTSVPSSSRWSAAPAGPPSSPACPTSMSPSARRRRCSPARAPPSPSPTPSWCGAR